MAQNSNGQAFHDVHGIGLDLFYCSEDKKLCPRTQLHQQVDLNQGAFGCET